MYIIAASDSQSLIDTPSAAKCTKIQSDLGIDAANTDSMPIPENGTQVVKNLSASWAMEDSSMISMYFKMSSCLFLSQK